MTPNKNFTILAYVSVLPLFAALLLACYQALDIAEFTGYSLSFARINSYIFAHSYGALLLALFAGIQIGQNLQSQNHLYRVFNFALLWLAWLSYHSFADVQGMALLLCCWVAALLIDITAKQNNTVPHWYSSLKIKIDLLVLILLILLLAINR